MERRGHPRALTAKGSLRPHLAHQPTSCRGDADGTRLNPGLRMTSPAPAASAPLDSVQRRPPMNGVPHLKPCASRMPTSPSPVHKAGGPARPRVLDGEATRLLQRLHTRRPSTDSGMRPQPANRTLVLPASPDAQLLTTGRSVQRNPRSTDTPGLPSDFSTNMRPSTRLYRVYEICPACDDCFFPETYKTDRDVAEPPNCPNGCEAKLEVMPYSTAIRL